MSKVYTEATMSLDGFIADAAHGGFEHLFGWYGNGEVTVPTARADMAFQVSPDSADHLRELLQHTGALVVGRRVFDLAGDRWVGVNGGNITRQCLDAGLLDEIRVNLAPVMLGEGMPFFGSLRLAPIDLDGPRVVAGTGVTHLYYRVRRRG